MVSFAGAANLEGALLECLCFSRLRRTELVENELGRLGVFGCSHPQEGHCCVSCTKILSKLGYWILGIS